MLLGVSLKAKLVYREIRKMTNLVLNYVPVPETYKAFEGRNIDTMPELIKEGRTPLSAQGLMERRLQVLSGSDAVKDSWWNIYFGTGDGIAYHPDGRIKVVTDAELLRGINPKSRLNNGGLVLEDGVFDSLEGTEFSKNDVQRYAINMTLTEAEVTQNPIWLALARDEGLLQEYVGATFKQAQERFNSYTNMGIYVYDAPEQAIMLTWVVNSIFINGNSSADGYGRPGKGGGRLVGVLEQEANITNK